MLHQCLKTKKPDKDKPFSLCLIQPVISSE